MLLATPLRLLRPRYVKFTPPPLVRRSGEFRCRRCKFWWHSDFVWVTRASHVCYQGQECERCGNIEKPYHLTQCQLRPHAPPAPQQAMPRYLNWRKVHSHSKMNRGRG